MNLSDITVTFRKNTNSDYPNKYGFVSIEHKYFKINFIPIFIREDGGYVISTGSFVDRGKPINYCYIRGELREQVQFKLDILLNKKHEWHKTMKDIKEKKRKEQIKYEEENSNQDGWITIPD